jgi:hypothetical protein
MVARPLTSNDCGYESRWAAKSDVRTWKISHGVIEIIAGGAPMVEIGKGVFSSTKFVVRFDVLVNTGRTRPA